MHVGDVDFGFSSSVTALYVLELHTKNQIARIVRGRKYDKKTSSEIAHDMYSLHRQIPHLRWFIDGANRGAVNECKAVYGERIDWIKSEDVSPEDNYVNPVSFGKFHKEKLEHTYHVITRKLAIPKEYNTWLLHYEPRGISDSIY